MPGNLGQFQCLIFAILFMYSMCIIKQLTIGHVPHEVTSYFVLKGHTKLSTTLIKQSINPILIVCEDLFQECFLYLKYTCTL